MAPSPPSASSSPSSAPRQHLLPLPYTAASTFSASRRRSSHLGNMNMNMNINTSTNNSHGVAGKAVFNRPRGDRGRFISPCTEANRVCRECGTAETSQWRTAGDGSSLCNACGIRSTRKRTSRSRSNNHNRGRRTHSTLHISPLQPPPSRAPPYTNANRTMHNNSRSNNLLPSYEQLASSVRSHAYPKPNSSLAKILN